MKTTRVAITTILALGLATASAKAADKIEDQLKAVVVQGLAAYDAEDMAGTLRYIHTNSPVYESTKKELSGQFEKYELSNELLDFRYIGHDDEFAVARAKIKTVGAPGKPFQANVVDSITIFHQQNGQWKYWDEHVLGIQLLD